MAKNRIYRWLDSDLVGIPATLYTSAVMASSLLVFGLAGPVAGIIVAVALWIPLIVFAIRGAGRPPLPLGIDARPTCGRHLVLVVANRGLQDPALCAEVCRRAERTPTEALILAPVFSPSRFDALADDIDQGDLGPAESRVAAAVRALQEGGVEAKGHVCVARPLQAALDGLREFPANELVLLPGHESGWEGTEGLGERIRREVGVPVTIVEADARQPGGQG